MRERIRFVSAAILVVSVALLVYTFIDTGGSGRTSLGSDLGADYAGFYTAGWILNHRPATDLYDVEAQDRIHHVLHPHLKPEEQLPYLYPPFVAVAFRPLANLKYGLSFAIWLVLSLAFYLAGLLILAKRRDWVRHDRTTMLLAALAFEPFIMECWQGGQVSAVGFFCMVAAWDLDRRGRGFLSGMMLGLCLYKPTLLVVVIPMLVVSGRWRNLVGFAATAVLLAGFSLMTVGPACCGAFVRKLLNFSQSATQATSLELKTWKYIDLNAFTHILLGGKGTGQKVAFAALLVPTFVTLLVRARQCRSLPDQLWGVGLLGTTVLNLYVGIYDGVLVTAACLLLARSASEGRADVPRLRFGLIGEGEADAPRLRFGLTKDTVFWLAALWLAPWVTQPLARAVRFQLFTALILALVWRCLLCRSKDDSR